VFRRWALPLLLALLPLVHTALGRGRAPRSTCRSATTGRTCSSSPIRPCRRSSPPTPRTASRSRGWRCAASSGRATATRAGPSSGSSAWRSSRRCSSPGARSARRARRGRRPPWPRSRSRSCSTRAGSGGRCSRAPCACSGPSRPRCCSSGPPRGASSPGSPARWARRCRSGRAGPRPRGPGAPRRPGADAVTEGPPRRTGRRPRARPGSGSPRPGAPAGCRSAWRTSTGSRPGRRARRSGCGRTSS
jgi:hypothetical protein